MHACPEQPWRLYNVCLSNLCLSSSSAAPLIPFKFSPFLGIRHATFFLMPWTELNKQHGHDRVHALPLHLHAHMALCWPTFDPGFAFQPLWNRNCKCLCAYKCHDTPCWSCWQLQQDAKLFTAVVSFIYCEVSWWSTMWSTIHEE